MKNYYRILGVNPSATAEEVRRAYRVLARRYHPDVNPDSTAVDKFKDIAEAYRILGDSTQRSNYDMDFESSQRGQGPKSGVDAYRENQRKTSEFQDAMKRAKAQQRSSATEKFYKQKYADFGRVDPAGVDSSKVKPGNTSKNPTFEEKVKDVASTVKGKVSSTFDSVKGLVGKKGSSSPASGKNQVGKVSIIEASVTVHDAIFGTKKTIEIAEPEGARKVSVRIPPGVRSGSVVRLRGKGDSKEDLILIVRVGYHPFISIERKGLVLEVPISVREAIEGANVTIPTLEDQLVVKVPEGTQSGNEVRLKSRGITMRDGSKGDFFVRFMVHVPKSANAVGIKDLAKQFEEYYGENVRKGFPKSLTEI